MSRVLSKVFTSSGAKKKSCFDAFLCTLAGVAATSAFRVFKGAIVSSILLQRHVAFETIFQQNKGVGFSADTRFFIMDTTRIFLIRDTFIRDRMLSTGNFGKNKRCSVLNFFYVRDDPNNLTFCCKKSCTSNETESGHVCCPKKIRDT